MSQPTPNRNLLQFRFKIALGKDSQLREWGLAELVRASLPITEDIEIDFYLLPLWPL